MPNYETRTPEPVAVSKASGELVEDYGLRAQGRSQGSMRSRRPGI
jgi:hypothetical protein